MPNLYEVRAQQLKALALVDHLRAGSPGFDDAFLHAALVNATDELWTAILADTKWTGASPTTRAMTVAILEHSALAAQPEADVTSGEIDFAGSVTAARSWGNRRGLKVHVVSEAGPGGGHPIVTLTGPKAKVDHALEDGGWAADQVLS